MATTTETTALDSLSCPECGNDGRAGVLRYLVDATSSAEVIGVRRGVIELAAAPQRWPEAGSVRPRIECAGLRDDGRLCGHVFALPTVITGVTWKVRA